MDSVLLRWGRLFPSKREGVPTVSPSNYVSVPPCRPGLSASRPLKVLMPHGGRIDVPGKTGSEPSGNRGRRLLVRLTTAL